MIDIILGLISLVIGIVLLVEAVRLMFMSKNERVFILDKLNRDHAKRMNERKFVTQLIELARHENDST